MVLRCSGAHQTGSDVVKSALLGADSFEFGTTALMMLKCVMAKNCNVKCPAGLTTNPEVFDGDPRALAMGKLGQSVKKAAAKEATGERSLSAYVWGFDAKVSGPDLVHHNVFFSDEPNSEFYDIKQGKMPIDPSIYICAQDRGNNAPYPTTDRFEIILYAPPVSKRKSTPED